jgi:hypothetical protein
MSFRVTSDIGPRWGGYHAGIDIAMPEGTPLRLPQGKWQIEKAGWQNPANRAEGYGKRVVARNLATQEKLIFGHLSRIAVTTGQTIEGGALVGASGNTGRSTGAHLHLEARDRQNRIINPLNYYKGRGNQSRDKANETIKEMKDGIEGLKTSMAQLASTIKTNNLRIAYSLMYVKDINWVKKKAGILKSTIEKSMRGY